MLLVIATIPAFAENHRNLGEEVPQPLTATIEQLEYNSGDIIYVNGTAIKQLVEVENESFYAPQIGFVITDSNREEVYHGSQQVYGDGTFWRQIMPINNIADWSATGTYTLVVSYGKASVSIDFEFVDSTSLLVVPEYNPAYLGESIEIAVLGASDSTQVLMTIQDSSGDIILLDSILSNNDGNAWFDFNIDSNWLTGDYTITVRDLAASNDTPTKVTLQVLR